MKFKIHFAYPDGTGDWFIVEGKTIEEVRAAAVAGLEERNGVNPWSEDIYSEECDD